MYRWFTQFLNLYARPEIAFASWTRFCSLALLMPPVLAILNYAWRHDLIKLPQRAAKVLCSRWLLFASIAVCLVICRYPTLLENEFNPDEGQFIAAAHKLFYDPNFFHSVDCGTSGPINIYPLMLPAIFGLTPDFASSRVLVLLVIFLSTYLLYRTVALVTAEDLARLAILPLVGAFAVFKNAELVHYSSEHIPLLLISVTLYCSVRLLRDPRAYCAPMFLLGLLACAAFFTKMQSLPIVVALAGVGITYVYATANAGKLWRPALLFCAGAVPLLIAGVTLCLLAGVWDDFRMSYIQSNWSYANIESRFVTVLPLFLRYLVGTNEVRCFLFMFAAIAVAYGFQRMRREATTETGAFLQMATVGVVIAAAIFVQTSERIAMYAYLALIAVTVVPIYLFLLCRKGLWGTDPVRWFGFLALAAIGSSVFAIYKAHHGFAHYLLFLFIPLCTAMAWMLIRQSGVPGTTQENDIVGEPKQRYRVPARLAFIALFLTLTITYQSYLWGFQDDHVFKHVPFTIRAPEGDFIRSLTSPGGRITVWGWTIHPFLSSGRVPATRDTNVANSFRTLNLMASPPIDNGSPEEKQVSVYYTNRLLRDLRKNPAELFIDATGPTSWFLTNPKYFSFEQFPEVATFVKANYVYLVDLYGQRYFLRRDLATRRDLAFSQPLPARSCAAEALRCVGVSVILPRKLPPIQMPRHALLQAEFMPVMPQIGYATVFSNEAEPGRFQGFQFQHVADDRYRLVLGLGNQRAISKEILLPQSKPVSLSIQFNENVVSIGCNGTQIDELHLPHPIADSPGPITLDSWINGDRVFSGKIQFFQVLDLDRSH